MLFSVGATLAYQLEGKTPFIFNLEAVQAERQSIVSESLTFSPSLAPSFAPERFRMPETGNRYVRILAGPGTLQVEYRAEIEFDPLVHDPAAISEIGPAALPLATIPHLNPSRFCESDLLHRFAQRAFGHLPPGHARVGAICNWLHDNVDYVSGSTDELTSAVKVITNRAGVCRDFAHLAIAFCRALGIPARYVSAYAWQLDPPDFHAVVECFLDGPAGPRWYLFDPTRKAAPDGLIRIGVGRDASDIPFAAPFAPFEAEKPVVWIEAKGATDPGITTQAVSVSAT